MRSIIYTSLLAVGLAAPTLAQDGPDLGCYQRTYSDAHLAQHPDQVVKSIWLWVYDQAFDGHVDRFAHMDVQFADQGHVRKSGYTGALRLDQYLVCFSNSDGPGCAAECDGGSFTVTKQTADSLTFATEYLMVGDTEGCGGMLDLAEKIGREVKYKLNRVDPVMCSGL